MRARSVPSHPSHSGRVIETFVFGIVKVCEDGKMVLKRRTDIDEDFKLRNFDKRGRINSAIDKDWHVYIEQTAHGEVKCTATETWS